MNKVIVAAVAAMAVAHAFAEAKTAVDLPVSAIGNTACMSSMSGRPWWNKAWTRRAPLLISSAADVEDRNVMVDAIVDFGEEVNPDEVRLVTPWEELVDCVAEQVKVKGEGEQRKIRLLFKTGLRVRENKPFLVYWGNPKAKKTVPVSALQMYRKDGDLRVMNGKIDVSFDLQQRTQGLLRRLRILGSQAPTEILMRSTGYAWEGFATTMGRWTNATVVADNAFKKAVAFEFPNGTVTMTVYDEQPRIDWSYAMAKPWMTALRLSVSWACGGDCGFDRLVYPGLAGKPLSVVAEIDSATDCIQHPKHDLTNYIRDGWYALHDRRVSDVVGMVFDRKSVERITCTPNGQAWGVPVELRFLHAPSKEGEPCATGAGAIVAMTGKWQDIRAEYERLNAKPLVFTGKPEGVRDIPVTRPRLDHDWVYSIDAIGWHETEPLEGAEWATNAACRLRALGANVSRAGPGWAGVPVPHDLYVSVTNRVLTLHPGRNVAKWGERDNFTGSKFRERCDAAHAKGMSVSIWGGVCGDATYDLERIDPELLKYDIEIQNLYPKCGLDCVYNAAAQGEGAILFVPEKARAKWRGLIGNALREKTDAEEYFRYQDENTERVKTFYKEAKKRNPGVPVMMWNSENSEVLREMFMGDQAGYFDTCMVEILPHYDIPHVKNVVKRMRALFDNDAGRTVHHHYYFYGTDRQDFSRRISEIEMPFLCGCNGFNQENLTYEHYDRDATEIPADFARFAEYTRLGEKAAKMAPVKNLAVFRDGAMYRYDAVNGLHGSKFNHRTRTDDRINDLGRFRNYSFDIVVNRYFTKDALAKYRVVYVPEDPVFTEDLAKELVAYVKQGGGAILEGDSLGTKALKALGLKDGEIKAVGKGKIVWFAKPPALDAKFQKTVADLGGKNPYDIESKTLDSVLQASKEGMLLGVFNMGNAEDTGKVRFASKGGNRLFVLDVKRGVRQAYTNGFEITVAPRQCGYYLIGNDAFTALPAAKPGVWGGAAAAAVNPGATMPVANVPTNFTPAVAVEYTRGTVANPQTTRRSFDNQIAVRPMTADAYSARKMNEALEGANYLHFVATDTKAADQVFADCPDALKALLKRGGGIVFDRMVTGPKARAFLKEVGVCDPNEAAVAVSDRGDRASSLPTNSLLCAKREQLVEANRFFRKWDKSRQFITHVAQHNPNDAVAVAQEKVLGAGKVIFSQNDRAFNDWYENQSYGNSIQSWMIGRQVSEHAQLVRDLNGGEGRVEGD